MSVSIKLLFISFVALLPAMIAADGPDGGSNNLLDVEPPTFFSYASPLRQPDSLRSRPYFDFLSTLYRRDADKSNLFSPYLRTNRAATVAEASQGVEAVSGPATRQKRAIIFRPLFVYRQEQIRRQHINDQRNHRY